MNLYETVKASVSVPKAAERYGLDVGRSGMTRCVFHDDRHPSMKLNEDYFYCFGCGEHGDVIDLTARLFGLSSREAAKKLAYDFGLSPDKPPNVSRRLTRMQELRDYRKRLRRWKAEFAPRSPGDEPDERYVEACKKLGYVEYLMDTLKMEARQNGKEQKVA